jgi:hypothetical protein
MKHIKLFEEFNRSNRDLDLVESIEALEEGAVRQVLGWTFFPVFSLANVIFQITQKKKKIKGMLATETNPKKKQVLKDQLEALSYEEVKAKKKAEDQKADLKDKAAAAKKTMTPEEKKQLAKETEKMQKKLQKTQDKIKKLRDSSDLSKGFA